MGSLPKGGTPSSCHPWALLGNGVAVLRKRYEWEARRRAFATCPPQTRGPPPEVDFENPRGMLLPNGLPEPISPLARLPVLAVASSPIRSAGEATGRHLPSFSESASSCAFSRLRNQASSHPETPPSARSDPRARHAGNLQIDFALLFAAPRPGANPDQFACQFPCLTGITGSRGAAAPASWKPTGNGCGGQECPLSLFPQPSG